MDWRLLRVESRDNVKELVLIVHPRPGLTKRLDEASHPDTAHDLDEASHPDTAHDLDEASKSHRPHTSSCITQKCDQVWNHTLQPDLERENGG